MNDTATLASVVALVACLFLALRGMRGRNVHRNRILVMGVIWAVVITGLAVLLQRVTS